MLNIYLEILLAQKEYPKALKVCQELLSQDPENKEIMNYKVALMIEPEKRKRRWSF